MMVEKKKKNHKKAGDDAVARSRRGAAELEETQGDPEEDGRGGLRFS